MIRTAIMTGVLISRGNIQYCVVAEMLVSEQVGRSSAATAGAHDSLYSMQAAAAAGGNRPVVVPIQ